MDGETCADHSHMLRRFKKKKTRQNKNNTGALGKVGMRMSIIAWVYSTEIKVYISLTKLSVTLHRMKNNFFNYKKEQNILQ